MIARSKRNDTPLYFLFAIDFLFSVSFGMFAFSAYIHIFENHPLTSFVILGLIYHVMSISGAINVITSFIGKYIIDFKRLFFYALLLQIFGCYVLSYNSLDYINLGLALYAVGYGISVTCLTIFIHSYLKGIDATDNRSKIVFTWYAMFFNLGMLVGCIIGLYAIDTGILFVWAFIFCIISLGAYISCADKIDIKSTIVNNLPYRHLLIITICVFIISLSYLSLIQNYGYLSDFFLVLTGLALMVYLIRLLSKMSYGGIKKVITFTHYLIYTFIFWVAYRVMQLITGYLLITHSGNKIFSYHLALSPEWVGIINIVVVVIASMFLPKIYENIKISFYKSFQISLVFMLLAYVLIYSAFFTSTDGDISLMTIICFIILVSFGEVLMLPLNYTIVKEIIPDNDAPIFYGGVGFMLRSVAPAMSGIISQIIIVNDDDLGHMFDFNISFLFLLLFLFFSIISLKFISKQKFFKV